MFQTMPTNTKTMPLLSPSIDSRSRLCSQPNFYYLSVQLFLRANQLNKCQHFVKAKLWPDGSQLCASTIPSISLCHEHALKDRRGWFGSIRCLNSFPCWQESHSKSTFIKIWPSTKDCWAHTHIRATHLYLQNSTQMQKAIISYWRGIRISSTCKTNCSDK